MMMYSLLNIREKFNGAFVWCPVVHSSVDMPKPFPNLYSCISSLGAEAAFQFVWQFL